MERLRSCPRPWTGACPAPCPRSDRMAEAAWIKVVTARADLNFPSEQEAREALRKATDRTDAITRRLTSVVEADTAVVAAAIIKE